MKLKVIGLDPGTLNMGYGIMSFDSHHFEFIDCSFIQCSQKQSIEKRLYRINQELDIIFKKHRPDHVALERIFLGKNAQSSFKLGQAFGMGLYQSQKWSCSVFEYGARTVKKALTGTGSASKESVYFCLKNILKVSTDSLDASDALAIALCHIYNYQMKNRIQDMCRG